MDDSKYSSGTGTRRGTQARYAENLANAVGQRPVHMEETVGPCQIEGIIGPEDADLAANSVPEQYHVWVEARLPHSPPWSGGTVRVPLAHDIHTIYTLYGNPGSLRGMFCNIRYRGSMYDVESGEAFISCDLSTTPADQEKIDQGSIDLSIAALTGTFKEKIELLIDSMGKPGGDGSPI